MRAVRWAPIEPRKSLLGKPKFRDFDQMFKKSLTQYDNRSASRLGMAFVAGERLGRQAARCDLGKHKPAHRIAQVRVEPARWFVPKHHADTALLRPAPPLQARR